MRVTYPTIPSSLPCQQGLLIEPVHSSQHCSCRAHNKSHAEVGVVFSLALVRGADSGFSGGFENTMDQSLGK